MIWGFIRSKQLVWSLNISTLYWEMMKIIKYKISIEHLQVNWIGLKWCRNLWGASNQGRIFTANESLVSELYFFGKFLVTLQVTNLADPSSLSVLVRFSLQVKPLFSEAWFMTLGSKFRRKSLDWKPQKTFQDDDGRRKDSFRQTGGFEGDQVRLCYLLLAFQVAGELW